jgi:hypothetical protein
MAVAGAIGGALIQGSAARRAARAQQSAADADRAFQIETRDLIRGDLAPFREGGLNAFNMYSDEVMGTGPTQFQRTQDYNFGLNEGINAVQAGAAARGGLFSGATMKDLNTFGQDYASTRREGWLNRLGGLADTGLNAAQMSGNASTNAAAGVSNALAAAGNARAAGAIGVGNAFNQGIGNALGAWNYQRQVNAGQPPQVVQGGPVNWNAASWGR